MEMTILARPDNITHVVLAGRLDSTAADTIDEQFLAATAARQRPTIVDLAQIEFMASRGIGLLLASCKRLQKAGCKLVLLNPQPLVDSSLRTTRIDRVMPIAYELEAALRIVQGLASPEAAPSRQREAPAGDARGSLPVVATATPTGLPGKLKLALNNEMPQLRIAHAALAEFLANHGVGKRAAYAASLAIDELVTNVIRYAYVDDDVHVIDLHVGIEGEQILLRIIDDGRPFDPRTGPALDLHAEDRQVGGLGLLMVLDMVDALKYRRDEEKNWVEVRIRLAGAEDETNAAEIAGTTL